MFNQNKIDLAKHQAFPLFQMLCPFYQLYFQHIMLISFTACRYLKKSVMLRTPRYASKCLLLHLLYVASLNINSEINTGKDSDAGRDWGQEEKGIY